MRIMKLAVIGWITFCVFVVPACQGFVGQIPCKGGHELAHASAFLFCAPKEIDDETTISGSTRAEADVSTDVGEEP